MDAFNSPVLEKTQLGFCRFSLCRPCPPLAFFFPKNPSWNHRNRLNFLLKVPFSGSSSTSYCRNLRISAHFGRASKRQNSLRKKLIEEGKVRKNPEFFDPSSNPTQSSYVSNDKEKSEFDLNFIKESNFKVNEGDDIHCSGVERSSSLGGYYVSDENEKTQTDSNLVNADKNGFMVNKGDVVQNSRIDKLNSLSNYYVYGEKEKSRLNLNYTNEEERDFNGNGGDSMQYSRVGKLDTLGDSVLRSKLENWVDQYKKDIEYWGVGLSPIFTIYKDVDGSVNRVAVNKDEIHRRSQVKLQSFKSDELGGDTTDVNSKILRANLIAKEIETGEYKLPEDSPIAAFVVEGKQTPFIDGFRSIALRGNLFFKFSRLGYAMLCGCLIFWVAKKVFLIGDGRIELTSEEEEMLRRKVRSRVEKAKMEHGSVEVISNDLDLEAPVASIQRPQLDKDELMKSISKAETSNSDPALDSSTSFSTNDKGFDAKILEIREMARHARELERQDLSTLDKVEVENDISKVMQSVKTGKDELSVVLQAVEGEVGVLEPTADRKVDSVRKETKLNSVSENKSCLKKVVISIESEKSVDSNHVIESTSRNNTVDEGGSHFSQLSSSSEREDDISPSHSKSSIMEVSKQELKIVQDSSGGEHNMIPSSNENEEIESHKFFEDKLFSSSKSSVRLKPRIIRSIEEARDYLSQMHGPIVSHRNSLENNDETNGKEDHAINTKIEMSKSSKFDEELDPNFAMGASKDSTLMKELSDNNRMHLAPNVNVSPGSPEPCSMTNASSIDIQKNMLEPQISWMEKNFQEFEPIIKKIGVGFQENYRVAKEKVQSSLSEDVSQPGFKEDNREPEWMKDDDLREIVFQVRENELAGRDPFHMMDAKDQQVFFEGLEREVEKENEKLLGLHDWVHSRVENLDYGADGISLDDLPEKIIPRWKGPTLDKDPEFLNDFKKHRNSFFTENLGMSQTANRDQQESLQKKEQSSPAVSSSSEVQKGGASADPKTLIECSDGSSKAGTKSGNEHWQHTKKWSREFLEAYNAETDPEVKSIMKVMGKDLDRWITEKEVQEVADLMTRIPKKKRRYIEKKMDKLKREMEMFGPQAVVSKYREYSEEKEEDYLWWLDLRFILCIEMYTEEDDVQKVGFYSLEMGADLELDPKQYHVVSFEDPGDCRNFCYIIQAHLEMLGNSRAYVVARPPKDAFREAKANGFNVTVIRKGQLQLNIDQTLEEVEDEITEIGSKMYHDKIMRERSVDMGGLMKGVFSSGKSTKRRSKRVLSKPTKS